MEDDLDSAHSVAQDPETPKKPEKKTTKKLTTEEWALGSVRPGSFSKNCTMQQANWVDMKNYIIYMNLTHLIAVTIIFALQCAIKQTSGLSLHKDSAIFCP